MLFLVISIIVSSCLVAYGLWRRNGFKQALSEAGTLEGNFSPIVWPYTAIRIGMVGSRAMASRELPKNPQLEAFGENEFSGYGYDLTLTVPGGRVWTQYANKEENLKTLLRVPRVLPARSEAGDQKLVYRIYTTLPTDNLQKTWNWKPELATNDATRIAVGMGQRKVFYQNAATHTMAVGMSGAGKSSITSTLFQNLAADPTVEIWAIDAKAGGGDVKTWGHLCSRIAYSDGPAGDLAMFILLQEFANSFRTQQSLIPRDKKQIVPSTKKNPGPDDVLATAETPTKILIIDEYNIFSDAMKSFVGANKNSSIKKLAEEFGYYGNPLDDVENILNGGRSSNHWLWAIGQNPLATSWHAKRLFQNKVVLKLGENSIQNLFSGDADSYNRAREAWNASVDRKSPAKWGDGERGFAMVEDKGEWHKIRYFYSDAMALLKLRKEGIRNTVVENHKYGSSAPWSVSLSGGESVKAVLPSNTNSLPVKPVVEAPVQTADEVAAELERWLAEENEQAPSYSASEIGGWTMELINSLHREATAQSKAAKNRIVEYLRTQGITNPTTARKLMTMTLWETVREMAPAATRADDRLEETLKEEALSEELELQLGGDDDAFLRGEQNPWDGNGNGLIGDDEELKGAMIDFFNRGFGAKLNKVSKRQLIDLVRKELDDRGTLSYKRILTITNGLIARQATRRTK